MNQIKNTAEKYAVKNAFEHNNKADLRAVVGKVKALFPELDLKKEMNTIKEVVDEVNKLSKKELEEKYKVFEREGWELRHIEKEKTLPELDWFKPGMKLITRVAPNPSGAMHFGHARPAILTDEYVKKYGGKFILRFDDTDPKVKTPVEGIEEEFLEEFKWLGIRVDEVVKASDHLERYYEVIEELIKNGKAYVCDCEPEEWRKLIWESKACKCREKEPKEQLAYWTKMLKHEVKEGEAVVRIKTDLNHKDPATRDWWLAKIVDEVNHPNPKVKDKHVWPSYNLASAVDDHDMNINFIIRGQEHIGNEEKQRALYNYFGWTYPHTYYHGKISKLGDMVLSKSKIKVLMEKGGLTRDDDPRLATIKSFRRRGFKPEAIRKIIIGVGLNINEAKISLENLGAINKEFLGEVREYPLMEEVVELEVVGVAPGNGELYGGKVRFESPIQKFLVERKELLKHSQGKVVRLKKAFNIKLEKVDSFGGFARFVSYAKQELPILNWVFEPSDVEILMSDGKVKQGFSAPTILKEKVGEVIRFEGLGYAKIEEINENKINCIFTHN